MCAPHDYGHGGEVYSLSRRLGAPPEAFLDFSSNANIFAEPLTRELVLATPYPFEHYPDSRASALVEALSEHENIAPERILQGNGAAELIWLAIQALAPRKALCVGPIFSEFVRALQAYRVPHEILMPPAERHFACGPAELEKIWNTDADLVILCTPNNPAGVTYENIHALLNVLRAPRVLIDNSYREFLYGAVEYEQNHFHAYQSFLRPGVSLFTLHSLTKFFCCPGIRLGYILGDALHLARMASLRPSWTVSAFAQLMGRIFLEHKQRYRDTLPALFSATAHMGRELRRLGRMVPEQVFEGPGFLCCKLAPGLKAAALHAALLKFHILIRDCDAIPGMPPDFIRLRARSKEDSDRLLSALRILTPLQDRA